MRSLSIIYTQLYYAIIIFLSPLVLLNIFDIIIMFKFLGFVGLFLMYKYIILSLCLFIVGAVPLIERKKVQNSSLLTIYIFSAIIAVSMLLQLYLDPSDLDPKFRNLFALPLIVMSLVLTKISGLLITSQPPPSQQMSLRSLIYIALFAAIIAALGIVPKINIPFAGGVPITAQSMGVMLAGVILGARFGALSMLLFLALVAMGLPLLSGGRGGLAPFWSASLGFLIGFVVGAFATGLIFERLKNLPVFWAALIASAIGGIGVIYLFGVPIMAWFLKKSLLEAAAICSVFLVGDVIKVVATAFIAESVRRTMPAIFVRHTPVS